MSLLSADARQSADASAQHFCSADPFRHVVIENFLEPGFCRELLADFPCFEDRYALNEMGEVGDTAVRMDVRELSAAYRRLDDYLQTREFLDYVSRVTGIADLRYDEEYIGGGTHENRDGQSLDAHIDFNYHPTTRQHCRLNLIVYLNEEWEAGWGGTLQLHSDPWSSATNRTASVLPLFNRAVIFEANEHSWHGFDAIRLPQDRRGLSRKSFAIYLYTEQRPAAETAPPHATVYVPEAMPDDWQEGRALSAADLQLLQRRFTRLRGQLRLQYARAQHDSTQIRALERACDEAYGAWRLPLQGYAEQPSAPTGIWADLWVSPTLRLLFTPQRPLIGLEIELWAPEHLSEAQTLTIDVDGKRWTHKVNRDSSACISLDVQRPALTPVAVTVSASTYFEPAAADDQRKLAWVLIGMRLRH